MDPFSVRVSLPQASYTVTTSLALSRSLRIAASDPRPSLNSHGRGLTTTFAPPLRAPREAVRLPVVPTGKSGAKALTWHRSSEDSHPLSAQWARLSQHRISHKKLRSARGFLGVSMCQQPYCCVPHPEPKCEMWPSPVKKRPRPFLCILRHALKTGILNLILSSISSERKSQQAVSGDIFVQVQ